MKLTPIIGILILATTFTRAQEKTPHKQSDSLTLNKLDEVVLTGQYNPQSVDKSVFEVEVISQEQLKQLAGNTLADVLTQNLNMNIIPQAETGRSGIQQFGFNAEYVKILVDNVPLVGDEGFGNAIDITQINLDDIQQIEIIEGSMGVQYGANAVTGVVNIITKKGSQYAWQVTPYIQEETIGDEYSTFEEGRHIQALKVGHNFSDKFYANILYTRNDFQGALKNYQGKNYYNTENENDGLRGYQWLPKEQNSIKALLNYKGTSFRAFYKFEYFNEEIEKYNHNVNLNYQSATNTYHPTANDNLFTSNRWYHHLNISGKLVERTNFNISNSFQEQTRNIKNYTYNLKTGKESNIDQYDYNTRKVFFSRGTFNNFFNKPNYNIELGYEMTLDKGSASGLSSQDIENRTQTNAINYYNVFLSSEIRPSKRFSLLPGIRLLTSDKFSPEYALSFSGKYLFNKDYQLRMIIGTSPKLPNFEELYFYMVDSNHNIQGNPYLNSEKGKSIFLHLKKTFWLHDYQVKFIPKLTVQYLDVTDKIDLITISNTPLIFKYSNIDLYRTWGASLRNQLSYKNLSGSFGIGFLGHSKDLKSVENSTDDYLYALQANATVSYHVPKWNATFSTFFKYNGPEYQFVYTTNENNETVISQSKLEGYGWLNLTLNKTFYKNIELSLGVRNLLDINQVRISNAQGGTHDGATAFRTLGYGRSYFIKLLYNLNFK